METIRPLEPRRHADPGVRLPWGLYCPREGRWLDLAFSTEAAAREAMAILGAASGR